MEKKGFNKTKYVMKKRMKTNIVMMALSAVCLSVISCSKDSEENDVRSYLMSEIMNGQAADANGDQMQPASGDQFEEFADNPFIETSKEPASTFSVDADGASYGIVRRYLQGGWWDITPASVRIEEFLNYFTFDYPQPTGDDAVAINAEVGRCPWNTEHLLLRLGLKGKELKAEETPRANFVFLIDVSGSMASSDKLDLLKHGLTELLYQLNPDDRISIVTYSGEVKKLLESTSVR